ncbi:MAG TPA: ABC transporter permease subunit [Chloroflexaceae bacterium]|nr:ABC transporter permease subunit [Chloroflexaceae bacterium]
MRRSPAIPILFKEFAVQMRGSRAALLIAVYVGLAIVAARLIYGLVAGELDRGAPLVAAQIGQVLFIGLSMGLQALLVFLAPATTVNAISGEHERGTYQLLLTTPVTPLQLVAGKLAAALAFLLLLLLAALPVFAVVVLFGGITAAEILRVAGTLVVTAVAGCAFGLLCSAVTRQTYSATLLCYALLVSLVGGSLFAANVWSLVNGLTAAPPWLLVANPLSAMASALSPTRPPSTSLTGGLRPLALLNLLTSGALGGGAGSSAAPLYRATAVLYAIASLLIFWATLHVVAPLRRWRPTIVDAALLVLLLGCLVLAYGARAWWLPGLVRGLPG